MKRFLASVAAVAVMSGTAFAAEDADLLAIASNGALNEQSEGIQVLSKAEESNVVGGYYGYGYKLNYTYYVNYRNWLYYQQAQRR